ncbi:MAG: hypothetical protein IPK58_23780 [Acidobacteria bacterium]|nr:hypothetical protein [Acidobacteriota bacterium]
MIKAKKTLVQRLADDRRLLEADYFAGRDHSTTEQVEFWMKELQTPELLSELATEHPELARVVAEVRPLVRSALDPDEDRLGLEIGAEERADREADREYWRPLKAELEQLRPRVNFPQQSARRCKRTSLELYV